MVLQGWPGIQHVILKIALLDPGLCPARALAPSCPKPTHFAQLDLIVVIDVVVWIVISSTATLTLCFYPDSRWLISVLHYLVVFTNYLHSGCARKRTIPVIFSSYRLVPGQRASIETVPPSSGPAILRGTKWDKKYHGGLSRIIPMVPVPLLFWSVTVAQRLPLQSLQIVHEWYKIWWNCIVILIDIFTFLQLHHSQRN